MVLDNTNKSVQPQNSEDPHRQCSYHKTVGTQQSHAALTQQNEKHFQREHH